MGSPFSYEISIIIQNIISNIERPLARNYYINYWVLKGKGKRYVSRSIIQISPVGTADFTLFTPRYWNSPSHSLISLGRMQRILRSCSHSHNTNFHSTWYPLLLGGQRWCGFKAYPRLLHMTDAAGIDTETPRSRVQRLILPLIIN